MMRNLSSDEGTLPGDYNDLLVELGDIVGCAGETEKSFVVLSNTDFIPKTVFARCADSPQQASRFFLAAPAIDGDDMDPRILHLTGWDDDAKQYRHYATGPAETGGMNVNVEPSFCLGCHGGPEALPVWQPLMNEMTNPWSGWNAEPGFSSQLFDEYLDGAVATGEVYGEMLGESRLDSASNLEPLVRAGIARTVGARVLERNTEADTKSALDLLRPLFCDETVNYVSEVHRSGELRIDAAIDEGLRNVVDALTPEQSWTWRDQQTTLLPALEASDEPVTLIATRATISVEFEKALIARQVLDELTVLRIRALDWANPVGSELRCGTFRTGRSRIEGGALATELAALGASATTEDLMPLFMNELLAEVPVLTAQDAQAIGLEIETALSALDREQLRVARDQRGCWAAPRFAAAPIIPDLECP